MNQWKDRKKKLREGQIVIFPNGEKGWNSTKSEFSLILKNNKVRQVEKNIQ